MLSRFLLFICLLLLAHSSLACFSSGNPTERERNPEAAKLRRAEQNKQPDNNIATSAENGEPELEVEASFLKDYLREFGHLDKEGPSADLSRGIKHFQEFLGFKPTGRMDLPTLARMSWKRCGNPDEAYAAPQIWERTSLFWHLDTPTGADFPLPLHEMKELIRQAFTAWEIVIAMEFLEATSPGDAHIHFGILEEKAARAQGMRNGTSKTGLGIATASPAPLSKIWLNKHENWSTFQTQEEGKIDLFLVLIHEIGHSLGLKHSGDDQSVMFPMFERPVGEQLPVISNDDVERLRALYETSESVDATDHDQESAASSSSHGGGGSHHHNVAVNSPPRSPSTAPLAVKESDAVKDKACPHSITAAANVNPETLYVFNEGKAWLLRQGKLAGGPLAIEEVFPDGPDSVDVAFTAGRLTILTKGRIVFGYEFDAQQNKFTRAKGFPRELHNRILFTPEAAFPIANGSVILIKDKVFATYNVESNTPHMLGNVDEFFPNLPEGLRSGFPASPDFSIYHMLTPEYAFLYDVRITRSVGSQSIGQFLGCDPQSTAGSLQPPPQSSRPQQPQPVPLQPIRPSQPQQQGGPAQIPQQQPNRGSQQPTGTMVHGQGPPGARFWKRR